MVLCIQFSKEETLHNTSAIQKRYTSVLFLASDHWFGNETWQGENWSCFID